MAGGHTLVDMAAVTFSTDMEGIEMKPTDDSPDITGSASQKALSGKSIAFGGCNHFSIKGLNSEEVIEKPETVDNEGM